MTQSKRNFRTIDLTIGALFVGLMAIGANIAIWMPFLKVSIGSATVPISLQTFFATLAGLLLGKRLGAFSMFVYICVGCVGVPVFAEMTGGIGQLASPTGGFIISFIFVAWAAGYIVEKQQSSSYLTYAIAALAGLMMNYIIGTNFLYIALNTWMELSISYSAAWQSMIPFFIKDFALAFFVASLAKVLVTRVQLSKASYIA
ncbi:biotin transport system substrate-specific component [Salirhabdus euzebyi]|uniref:Biotin transporter n=1 Tax=Salirhabdus euzebyi TaxID=394506 RepID=A0A841Q4Z1_9BACI|nr:biotin transporter BioY [Salirhabdus euzebyi]MBB6453423.1 biotin transport system substrate-specific component [Salirhabdus euzebyi]